MDALLQLRGSRPGKYGRYRSVQAAAVSLVLMACGGKDPGGPVPTGPSGLAACGTSPTLTISPVPVSAIHEIAPLGSLNPPGHTTPTGHVYFYFAASGDVNDTPVPLVAPGDIVISSVVRQIRTGGGQPIFVDYAITFYPCADVQMFFGHVSELDPELGSLVGRAFALGGCRDPYQTGGFTYQQCVATVEIAAKAGTMLGTASGSGQGALDFGGSDRRVVPLAFANPSRSPGAGSDFGANQTICPVDYFAEPVRSSLKGLFGRGARRTTEPLCGEVMQDVPGTAQGRWYFGSSAQDDRNLALVHDNVDPAIGAISVGTAVPGLPSRVYRFTPEATGRVRTDFDLATADGSIYCYDATDVPNRVIFIQLLSSTRLRIEGRAGSACGPPDSWTFGSTAVDFER